MASCLESALLRYEASEVSAMEVYSDIFDLGSGFIQVEGELGGNHKANPIILGSFDGKIRRRILLEDTFEDTLTEFQQAEWAIVNGLTYWGGANTADSQSKLCALIFDLDGVGFEDGRGLRNFLHGASGDELDGHGIYPMPNYVILSGENVHLYYVFDEPLSLYPNTKTQLKELKYTLTDRMWNMYTSDVEPQHQGINQGFRVIGGKTKGGGVVRAFRLNEHPFTVEELNEYVPEPHRVDVSKVYAETKYTLDEAKRLFPDWYERIVVGGAARTLWTVKEDLYDWWLRKAREGGAPGHRYFCVMALAIFAAKCGIDDLKRVRADALSLLPVFNRFDGAEPFTEHDVDSALECLDRRYCTFPRDDIAKLTAIPMPANKRNGRTQAQHLKLARFARDLNYTDGHSWDDGNGRKPKRDLVRGYAVLHPEESQRRIAKALGVSPTTVNKWLKPGWREEFESKKKTSTHEYAIVSLDDFYGSESGPM